MSAAVQTKVPVKKATKPKVPAAHPKYAEMVAAAIASLKERGGSSRQAILKYVVVNYKVGTNQVVINRGIKTALKGGVTKGILKQVKGTGAAGSFRLGENKVAKKPKVAKPKKVKTPKKATTAKPKAKKAAEKPKAAAAKPKAAATKKVAKPKKAKSPKKAKTAAAKPKKAKTPKKKVAKKAPTKK